MKKYMYTSSSFVKDSNQVRGVEFYRNLLCIPCFLKVAIFLIISFQSSYSQLIAASSLTRLISKNTTLPVEQRLDMREYLTLYPT